MDRGSEEGRAWRIHRRFYFALIVSYELTSTCALLEVREKGGKN